MAVESMRPPGPGPGGRAGRPRRPPRMRAAAVAWLPNAAHQAGGCGRIHASKPVVDESRRARSRSRPSSAAPVAPSAPRRSAALGVAVALLALTASLLAAGSRVGAGAGAGRRRAWAALWGASLGAWRPALAMVALALRPAGRGRPRGRSRRRMPGRSSAVTSRALFFELAEREWSRARRYGTGAALLLVDIDRYLRLCEARGADAGDAVLAELLAPDRGHPARRRRADALGRRPDGGLPGAGRRHRCAGRGRAHPRTCRAAGPELGRRSRCASRSASAWRICAPRTSPAVADRRRQGCPGRRPPGRWQLRARGTGQEPGGCAAGVVDRRPAHAAAPAAALSVGRGRRRPGSLHSRSAAA